ncbi:MAG: hypothetical protein ACREBS_00660 [Nitrososphaerales archaeon]
MIEAIALFPASVGMNITYLTVITVMATLITIVGFIALFFSSKKPDEVDKHSLAKYEKHWVILIVVIFIAFSLSTISYLPYPYAHSNVKPTMTVDVQAAQFAWCLSPTPDFGKNCQSPYNIPVGNTVLFMVKSIDTTHGFGVYDSQGSILFQVQVMPGFTNSIMYQFTTPGIYYVRCLEFCGYGHYLMITNFNVTS